MVTAASCSYTDVQAAVAGAQAGQTVAIPAGDCDWTNNQLVVNAGIAIQGAGSDATILRRTAAMTGNNYLVRFDCYNGRQAKFSDMTLVGANLASSQDRGLGLIGGCIDFTVARAKFTHFVFAGVEVRGGAAQRGVIFSSQFIDNYNSTVHNLGYGVVVFGDGSWPNLELGSANAVFVEDNYMMGNRHHIASNNGARYVFRHNTAIATDLTKDFPQVDAHGHTASDITPHGTRSWEVYDNQFTAQLTSGLNRAATGMRGGDGIIARNTYGTNIAYPVEFSIEGAMDTQVCDAPHLQDQIKQAYIAETGLVTVLAGCSTSYIRENIEYFTGTLPANYTPYTYPHPLRASSL
jgi:hypothetical protein